MQITRRVMIIIGVLLFISAAILNFMNGAVYLAAFSVILMGYLIHLSIQKGIWKKEQV